MINYLYMEVVKLIADGFTNNNLCRNIRKTKGMHEHACTGIVLVSV